MISVGHTKVLLASIESVNNNKMNNNNNSLTSPGDKRTRQDIFPKILNELVNVNMIIKYLVIFQFDILESTIQNRGALEVRSWFLYKSRQESSIVDTKFSSASGVQQIAGCQRHNALLKEQIIRINKYLLLQLKI